jgi:hypothetical protein
LHAIAGPESPGGRGRRQGNERGEPGRHPVGGVFLAVFECHAALDADPAKGAAGENILGYRPPFGFPGGRITGVDGGEGRGGGFAARSQFLAQVAAYRIDVQRLQADQEQGGRHDDADEQLTQYGHRPGGCVFHR